MLNSINNRLKNTRGDTIVEVMIVLAVLGLAISISYATANRSLLETRQAQENSMATELVQAQIEGLRVLAPTTSPDPSHNIFIPNSFCVTTTNNTADPYNVQQPVNCTLPFVAQSSVTTYYCDGSSDSNTYNGSSGPADATICNDLSNDTFVVQASWPDVLGQGNDTVTQVYRVHKPTAAAADLVLGGGEGGGDITCPDGSTAPTTADCPSEVTCPDGSTADTAADCPSEVTCPDGSTADTTADCPQEVQCPDGSYADTAADCPSEGSL